MKSCEDCKHRDVNNNRAHREVCAKHLNLPLFYVRGGDGKCGPDAKDWAPVEKGQ